MKQSGGGVAFRSPGSRAWSRFISSKRSYYSLWIFVTLFVISLFAEVLSNDKPLIIYFGDHYYFPFLKYYPETEFGGIFETEADYNDPFIYEAITQGGNWAVYPPNRYSYTTINYQSSHPHPAPPSSENYLGTDDHGRDVLARLLYGFRLSVVFAFILTTVGIVIGISVGALQGYFGGRVDLFAQRFIEIWGAMPELYLLIIFSAIFKPNLLLLIILLSMFGWMGLSDYVRAEFLRARNLQYVIAARALGVSDTAIMWRHILPNGLTPVITFLPFRISAAILALTSLDFLGLGLPSTSPSLGELLSQSKAHIEAWWLSIGTFVVLVGTLLLLIFIGEGLRDAFDTRKE